MAVNTPSTSDTTSKAMGGFGDEMSALGDLMSKGPVAQNAARASGPANLPIPVLPMPQAAVPMVDPKIANAQRQQLAAAIQRLNSRRLT